MKFTKLLMACGAAALFPWHSMFGAPQKKRPGLLAPRYSRAPGECNAAESKRRLDAATTKRERRAAKLRKENPCQTSK